MSTTQGKIFVSLVAIVPPALLTTIYLVRPSQPALFPVIISLPFVYFYIQYVRFVTIPYFSHPFRHLAQPPDEDFFTAHWVSNFKRPRGVAYQHWIDQVPNSGLIYYRGPLHAFPTVLVTTPEAIQEFLITNSYDFAKVPTDRWLLEKFIGRGLIVVEGSEHKFQRKSVAPAFSGNHINDLVPLFWRKSREFADVIASQLSHNNNEKSRSGVVEINQWASRVTLDIIGLACVGRDFSSLYNSDDEIAQAYEKILVSDHGDIVIFALLTIFLPLMIARWQPFHKRVREAADGRRDLRRLCRRLIEVKRNDMQSESEKHIDILSVLMRSGQFTDDGLVDQLLTFLAAGHETTSGSLTWTLYLLATHPEAQTRLREELRQNLTNTASPPSTTADLESLPYLNAIVSEQLRLYPNVPLTGRTCINTTTLANQIIPAGTVVLACPWAVNRSHTYWGADSETFRPERWIESEGRFGGGKGGAMSLITFLHGPRSCIGQAFARAELRCLVAAMILKFDVQMADPSEVVEPGGLIAIKPLNGMRLKLRELA